MKKLVGILTAVSMTFASLSQAVACTSILITDAEGRGYHGRTLEYSALIPNSMSYFPPGTKIISFTPSGSQGLTFDTKYAILGMTAPIIETAKQTTFAEGMNDQGLSFSMNWLTGTTSPSVGKDNAKILSASDLGAWILGNFKTVNEVKQAMTNGSTEIWVPVVKSLDPDAPLPQHYAINDKQGGSIVIEFMDGKANVYDNPVGVLTNGPTFKWHLENLSNYTFTNVDKNTGQLGKLKLATQDGGIALTALPSAQTSQGRFVKAAFYANYVRKAKTPDDAVTTLAHIMNNFDRPYDLTVDGAGGTGDGVRTSPRSSEVTIWTVVKDLSRGLFYVRSINAMNWSVVDMNKLKDIKQVKSISAYDVDKAGADAFKLFYSSK
ncbi:linear amide C-N hydrolase [Zwartia vadi]|uniref:linear amide C-N hydrolase n=1 Tax=Zwartia vadi TaxID=3058168 RepID=UPI0025B2DAA5|nr:linear amide C-N hydrolase [Zwartia vadi]MDN3987379.1 linear amide C-N hydrolase [Zwartia vadi]